LEEPVAALNYSDAFERLIRILRHHRLDWVVVQVQEQIRTGKPATKEVITLRSTQIRLPFDNRFSSEPSRSGHKAEFVATEEYTPKERLLLTIDALERVVVGWTEMQKELYSFFADRTNAGHAEPEIKFEPEEFDDAVAFHLPRPNARSIESIAQLTRLLRDLRAQATDDDN
jgi:hypothetical protein